MVDRVRPLKLEDTGTGSQTNFGPTEMDPLQDYVSTKGVSFEGSDSYIAEKIGRILNLKIPDASQKLTYLVNGDLDFIEIFTTATQTTTNRIAKSTIAYDVNFNPLSETWLVYDTNGTSVLRTIGISYGYAGLDVTTAVEVVS